MRALMTISRSAVGVGGGELTGPVGFGVAEGFSTGCEGVAKMSESVNELLYPFSGRLRCACGFASIAGGQLLSGIEVAETINEQEAFGGEFRLVELGQHYVTYAHDFVEDVSFQSHELGHGTSIVRSLGIEQGLDRRNETLHVEAPLGLWYGAWIILVVSSDKTHDSEVRL